MDRDVFCFLASVYWRVTGSMFTASYRTYTLHFSLLNHQVKQNVIGKVALVSEGLWAETALKPCFTFDGDREMSCGA